MQRIFMGLLATASLAAPSVGWAQTSFPRGWVDVNFGAAAAAESRFETATTITVDLEPADFGAEYRLPSGASFDFGGGVMITPQVGLGISFSGTAHEEAAELRIRIPHPLFFDAFAADTSPTESKLLRVEGGVHVQVMLVPYDRDGLRLRLFGGPSRFRAEQEAISNIRYNQTYGLFTRSNTVRITQFESRDVEGTAWGVHVGGDVSWFFTRVVGLGGFARFSRASVEIVDPLDEVRFTVKAGGLQAGAGLRLRF